MKSFHPPARGLAAVALLAIVGCEANRYEITLTPRGETIHRELTCWREKTVNETVEILDFPEDQLDRIADAYGASVPDVAARKHKFAGTFQGELPDDVGGGGSYTHWNSPWGATSAYVERFRGNDDLKAGVEQRQEAADRITDLLIEWLAGELAGEPGLDPLRDFLDKQFRRDLKNLTLYGWAHGLVSAHEEAAQPEYLLRVGQYLVERSYFEPGELPAVGRALREAAADRPERLLNLVQRFAASKMGIADDQPIPDSLRFLADPKQLDASIDNLLRDTDEYRRMLDEWERDKATQPDADKPEPRAVLGELVTRAFLPNFHLGRSDRLSVTLVTHREPFQTNGRWDPKAGHVRWSERTLPSDSDPSAFPTLLYALWSEPEAEAQRINFGRIVLTRDALAEYCLWYQGLTKEEAAEWDAFASSLRPSDDLTARLGKFRFSQDPPAGEDETQAAGLAKTPRELLLKALD